MTAPLCNLQVDVAGDQDVDDGGGDLLHLLATLAVLLPHQHRLPGN
jgi:hypothetical protein